MTSYDYAVLVFYFGFMLAIGWVFRRFVTSVSDYVRGGGKALWWMVGGSAFMVAFSAWTFTGAAGEAYRTGWPIAIIYLGNIAGFVLNALHFGPRFRQMRVVTGVEAIRKRFGKASEQVFTWLQIPLGTLQAGIWLNALGVFFSTVLGLDVATTITVTGAVVVCMALVGGSWAVLASDFIQVLILMPVCAAVTVLVLVRAGGIGAFVEQVPAGHLDLGQLTSTPFLALWGVAMICKQITSTNNLADAGRYLCAKDGSHARKAGFLGAGLFVIGIVIWFVPPMAARFLLPDLASAYPGLKNPSEAAYLAMARDVMPVGMMGLLVSGIFAATMSSMDAGLNKNAGVFVKNFYQPQISPGANDRQLLRVGKIATLVLGGSGDRRGSLDELTTGTRAVSFDAAHHHPRGRTRHRSAAVGTDRRAHPALVRLEHRARRVLLRPRRWPSAPASLGRADPERRPALGRPGEGVLDPGQPVLRDRAGVVDLVSADPIRLDSSRPRAAGRSGAVSRSTA
jgi:SSS family solute:Na+ symporter